MIRIKIEINNKLFNNKKINKNTSNISNVFEKINLHSNILECKLKYRIVYNGKKKLFINQ